MIVNIVSIKLYTPWVNSLKEKRNIVKSLSTKLRNKFNVSIIESDAIDKHHNIILSVAFLAANLALSDSIFESIETFVENNTNAELIDIYIERR